MLQRDLHSSQFLTLVFTICSLAIIPTLNNSTYAKELNSPYHHYLTDYIQLGEKYYDKGMFDNYYFYESALKKHSNSNDKSYNYDDHVIQLKTKDKQEENDKVKRNNMINFAAVGDWDCGSSAKKTAKQIKKIEPELVLGLGDYSYSSNAKCWLKIVSDFSDKMKISLGNHDVDSSKKLRDLMEHFNLEKQYYSFNFKNIHFISMSVEVPFDDDSRQYKFVKKDLEKYSSDPFIDWIVVFYHEQAYGSGASPKLNDDFREEYHPLFDKYGVDLALQGHQHIYERTFPINFNDDDEDEPFIVDDNLNKYENVDGTIFVTVGTGGVNIGNFDKAEDYTAERLSKYGYLNIDLLKNGKILKGTFYDHKNKALDEFEIKK